MRLQFSFWDGRTRAKIVAFTRTDDSRNVGSKFRVRGGYEIIDKFGVCRSIELLCSTRSHFLVTKRAAEPRPYEPNAYA